MRSGPCHILFCDFEGEFLFSDQLTKIGFLVDHVRADSLKHVNVGDHQVYLFAFETDKNAQEALSTCERLKAAELPTAIVLMQKGTAGPGFLNHRNKRGAADAYVTQTDTVTALLDVLDRIVGCPVPPSMKGSLNLLQDQKENRAALEKYKAQVGELEEKIKELEAKIQSGGSLDHAIVRAFKPKLQALLKGQKLQIQTETERLKYQLSEMEALLMDREAKLKDLESVKEQHRLKLDELTKAHEKSQNALREFYRSKLKEAGSDKG